MINATSECNINILNPDKTTVMSIAFSNNRKIDIPVDANSVEQSHQDPHQVLSVTLDSTLLISNNKTKCNFRLFG